MADHDAESSSQALERYITAQLAALDLDVPSDDVEYMARFVEEEGLERVEKVEGVKGMLEGVVSEDGLPDEGLDEALGRVVDEWDRLKIEEAEAKAAAEQPSPSSPSPPPEPDPLAGLSEKEIAKLHAMRYAYLEGEEPPIFDDSNRGDAPPKRQATTEAEAKKLAEEKRQLIEAAIKLDGKKKKHRRQQEVDLLAPNLNREKIAYRAQMEKEAAKKAAHDKKDRDKAALDKQRADQAKAKADKQKKAAKQERRA
ncbi:hypothetical protein EHS25_009417 [Saitozyma podzolica]|uniref:Coiled-coil domain-containing protein 43 n=1 Tax=Saitozyma podzolica TaxID=1890683 RepID=A0A427YLU3_9TREE|nr:hypothetical protein EHS25_009417 [Saitozyma podzolica]